MSGYKASIMQATGAPYEDLAILEGIMRDNEDGTLDGLTPGQFNSAAKLAQHTLGQLREHEEFDLIEQYRREGS